MISDYLYGETDMDDQESSTEEKRPPIHPIDAEILTSDKYNRQIRKITYPSISTNNSGAFGTGSDISHTFEYSDADFSNSHKNYIKKQRIPVFRFNMTNPNILDFKVGHSNLYGINIMGGFSKAVYRKAAGVTEGILDIGIGTLPIRNFESALLYLRMKNYSLGSNNKKEILAGLAERISVELAGDYGGWHDGNSPLSIEELDAQATAAAVAEFIEDLEKGDHKSHKALFDIDQLKPGNPQSIMSDLVLKMHRESLAIAITTIPFFHISNSWQIKSPAIVYINGTQIIQSQNIIPTGLEKPKDGSKKNLTAYLSGEYSIFGFRHTITAKTAYSEFNLTRNSFPTQAEDDTEEQD